MKEFILGGNRSGKSAFAEQCAIQTGLPVTYIATAKAGDIEMTDRIARHRARRLQDWSTIEEPIHLADILMQHAAPERCLLVDCLTLWLCNLLFVEEASTTIFTHERDALLAQLPHLPGRIILVSNETGMGIVPMGELSRRFADEAGELNQAVAAASQRVTLIVAGLPWVLKGE